jgi:hypothetical protein
MMCTVVLAPPSTVIEIAPMHGDRGGRRDTTPAVVPLGAGALVGQPLLKKHVGGDRAALCANAPQAGLAEQIVQQSEGVALLW